MNAANKDWQISAGNASQFRGILHSSTQSPHQSTTVGSNAGLKGYHMFCADLDFTDNGKYLYGSNRGHDSIAMYSVNGGTGRLSLLGIVPTGGENPRNFGIDPTNRFVLVGNQSSDTVTYHRLDPDTGHLHLSGVVANIPMAVCLKMTLVV